MMDLIAPWWKIFYLQIGGAIGRSPIESQNCPEIYRVSSG